MATETYLHELKVTTSLQGLRGFYIREFYKQPGDTVVKGELIADGLNESDVQKFTATVSGTLQQYFYALNDFAEIDSVLCTIEAEREAAPETPDETIPPKGIPVVITQKMKQELADLGYNLADRRAMTPQQAAEILQAQKPKVSPDEIAAREEARKTKLQQNVARTNLKNLVSRAAQKTDASEEKIYDFFVKNEELRRKAGFNDLENERQPLTLNHANLMAYLNEPNAFFLSRENLQPKQSVVSQTETQQQQEPEQQLQTGPPEKIQPPKQNLKTQHQLWKMLGIKL